MLLSLLSGLGAGALHVVSGPDHLAAMAPIAAQDSKQAARLGFRWGLGHGIGAVALGLVGVAARDVINVHMVSQWSEFMVGFMLIGIGLWAFNRARSTRVHVHRHDHDGTEHQHIHVHGAGVHAEGQDGREGQEGQGGKESKEGKHSHSHAALYVGMLHGSAGSGHAFAVLPSLALPTQSALLYLAAYFVSAVGAMTVFGAALGRLTRGHRPERLRHMMYASSLAAVGVGVFWVGTTWPSVLSP